MEGIDKMSDLEMSPRRHGRYYVDIPYKQVFIPLTSNVIDPGLI